MIKITVEMVPEGTGKPEVVGTATIHNTGKGTKSRGRYRAEFMGRSNRVHFKSEVCNFPRLSCGVWSLIKRALENVR